MAESQLVRQIDLPREQLNALSLRELIEAFSPLLQHYPKELEILQHAALLPVEVAQYFHTHRYWFYRLGLKVLVEAVLNAIVREHPAVFFGTLCQDIYAGDRQAALAEEAPRQGITFVTMPKSGTVYLNSKLARCYPQPLVNTSIYPIPFDGDILPAWVDRVAAEGGLWCSHRRGNGATLAAMKAIGHDRVWVHLRNPLQATVSAYHFFNRFFDSPHLEDQFFRDMLLHCHLGPDYPTLPEMAQKAVVCRQYGMALVDFANEWLRAEDAAAEGGAGGLTIALGSQEAMVQDEAAYLHQVADFYAMGPAQRTLFLGQQGNQGNSRSGLTDEFLSQLPQQEMAEMAAALNPRLWSRFDWVQP